MKCKDCPISEDGDFSGITCKLDTADMDNRDENDECVFFEEDFDDLIQALQAAKKKMLRDKKTK